ncbi:MAG TPA: hypothetical protein DE191_12375 [Enterobacter sp.]|jgi:hypothetical protein|nr:hypothetical protein [Enterobacter sp.]
MLISCFWLALYRVFTASTELNIGSDEEIKADMPVRDADHLFLTVKDIKSVFLLWITGGIFSRL